MKKVGIKLVVVAQILSLTLGSCGSEKKAEKSPDPSTQASNVINYGVVKPYPHDTTAFTEGLLFYEGKLYESTGSPEELGQTRSLVGEVDLNTGQITKKLELDRNKYFGEGIVFLNDKLYWLTYKSKIAFIYNASALSMSYLTVLFFTNSLNIKNLKVARSII